MNAGAIRDICERRFSDTTNAVRTDAEWLDNINAAYREFVQATRWPSLVATASVTVLAGTRSIAAGATATQGGIVAVFDGTTPLDPQPADLPAKQVRFMVDQPSVPLWYRLDGNNVTVLPAPAANRVLTLHYMQAPVALTAADTPAIPETYHDALVAGALARAYRDDGSIELAQAYDAEFDRYVAATKPELAQ